MKGIFALKQKKRGAEKLVGLDLNKKFINKAKMRDSIIDFLNQGWDNLPDEKFDIILLLSALHYAEKSKQLLIDIYNRLSNNGLFILECGMIDNDSMEFIRVERGPDVRFFPTKGLLVNSFLSNFATKYVGYSVKQAGDPINRHVYHCSKRIPIILLIGGDSGTGKSVLCNELENTKAQIIKTDQVIIDISEKKRSNYLVESYIKEKMPELKRDIGKVVEGINKNEKLITELGEIICQHILLEERFIVIEGYALTDKVVQVIKEKLNDKAVIWEANRV